MPTVARYAGFERRFARPSPWQIGLAALVLAMIAYSTLCPIGLRPHLANANVERFAAYALLGLAVGRAAGRRGLQAAAAVVVAAFALEFAQRLAPGRHAQLSDAEVKALGGVAGVAVAQLSFPAARLLARFAPPRQSAEQA